jgi:rfaE bifunctional protein nucleotidyltransferase chain/domain
MAPMHTSDKIATLDQLMAEVKEWKKNKLKIVFTNGCFDILHVGHVDYLEKAKNLGDRLIIGLNTDLSVKKLKGTSRPIVGQGARSRIIASLAFVDAVILFEERDSFRTNTCHFA